METQKERQDQIRKKVKEKSTKEGLCVQICIGIDLQSNEHLSLVSSLVEHKDGTVWPVFLTWSLENLVTILWFRMPILLTPKTVSCYAEEFRINSEFGSSSGYNWVVLSHKLGLSWFIHFHKQKQIGASLEGGVGTHMAANILEHLVWKIILLTLPRNLFVNINIFLSVKALRKQSQPLSIFMNFFFQLTYLSFRIRFLLDKHESFSSLMQPYKEEQSIQG